MWTLYRYAALYHAATLPFPTWSRRRVRRAMCYLLARAVRARIAAARASHAA